jgi:hypothetical protein
MKLLPEIWFWGRNFKFFRFSLQYTHLFPWIRVKEAFSSFENALNRFFAWFYPYIGCFGKTNFSTENDLLSTPPFKPDAFWRPYAFRIRIQNIGAKKNIFGAKKNIGAEKNIFGAKKNIGARKNIFGAKKNIFGAKKNICHLIVGINLTLFVNIIRIIVFGISPWFYARVIRISYLVKFFKLLV